MRPLVHSADEERYYEDPKMREPTQLKDYVWWYTVSLNRNFEQFVLERYALAYSLLDSIFLV